MAGHNKWSKVKHVKGAIDAKRGKLFSKLSREITIATKEGGGDADMNPRLRQAINAAKAQNMPKDNIEKALKKGTGELEGAVLEETTYEGFAAGGVAFIVEVATDNRNRSAADIRTIFNRNNGNLGTSGSVSHLFVRRGEIRVPLSAATEEALLETALEAGAEDVATEDEDHIVYTSPDQLSSVGNVLREKNLEIKSQKLVYVPQNHITVTQEGVASQILRLYEALDDYDDTLNVFANFDIPDHILEAAMA